MPACRAHQGGHPDHDQLRPPGGSRILAAPRGCPGWHSGGPHRKRQRAGHAPVFPVYEILLQVIAPVLLLETRLYMVTLDMVAVAWRRA